jgi:acetyltransferase-like isoleucine patch superfamily enzyme
LAKPIVIKRNAWIGAGAIILPGVTVGENSVVAAGATVAKDVPANSVAAGIPAKVIKNIT